MRQVAIKRVDGNEDIIDTYDIHDFPYEKIDSKAFLCRHKKQPSSYSKTFATFDIETTTYSPVKDKYIGFMWHWQMSVGGIVCTGRYWDEWLDFIEKITELLHTNSDRYFVIYVHNLPYEFQFMKNFITKRFGECKIFAAQKRKPIYVTTENGIQFRCSYKLTNMSLDKAVKNELGVIHAKAVGDLDYRIFRTANTPMSDLEFGYNVSDVVCLYEMIENRMNNEHDNLESIPMTSTGYVRRDCRNSVRKDKQYRKMFLKQKMTESVYRLLKEAGRGGDTHANRHMSGRIWHDVDSFDVASSYPAQMKMRMFPMTKFTPYGEIDDMDEFNDLLSKHACLFRVIFEGLRLKDDIAMPYIPVSKVTSHSKVQLDNERVLTTITDKDRGYLGMTITDVDYRILCKQYSWDSMDIIDMHIAEYGYLPEALLTQVMEYFNAKTELKIKISHKEKEIKSETNHEKILILKDELANLEYLYNKSKNRLNGIFGMCYTDPVHDIVTLNENGIWTEEECDVSEALEKYWKSRNSFLVYAWGVWITAWARTTLNDLVSATGQTTTIYCDTDSSKAVDVDLSRIEELNNKIMKIADIKGAYCDADGKRFYMGIYEHENKKPIKKFITLGAKKYCYEDEKGLHPVVSGVSKKLVDDTNEKGEIIGKIPISAKELKKIENFRVGFIFHEAGGNTLYYNDTEDIDILEFDNCKMQNASNIGMTDSTYKLGITDEYLELIGFNIYYDIEKTS